MSGYLNKQIGLFGASGYLGDAVLKKLAKDGYKLVVATRNPYEKNHLKIHGEPGQITLKKINIFDTVQIEDFIKDCDFILNAVGILNQKGENTFKKTHIEFTKNLVNLIKANKNIKKYIHVSSLGVKQGTQSEYLDTKYQSEEIVKKELDNYVICKPSVIVGGNQDKFTNMFAKLAKYLPIIPLAGSEVKFQPVHVGDVASAISKIFKSDFEKVTFELAGPDIFTLKEMLSIISSEIRSKNIVVPINFSIARIQGFFFGLLPNPILTLDQVKTLESGDNILSGENKTLGDLNIKPKTFQESITKTCVMYRPEGQFTK